jgi:TPR repeat protein
VGFFLLAGVLLVIRPIGPSAATMAYNDALPNLLVGPVIVAEPWTPTAVPIQLGPAQAIPRGSWIKISGMPALASLSSGYTFGRGVWKIPVAALSSLTITTPARESIGSEVHVALMSADGAILAEVQSVLAVIPASMCGAAPKTIARTLPDEVAPGAEYRPSSREVLPVLSTEEDRRRAHELVLKGEINRLEGRYESARGYYEHAANAGSPDAAMALAATFDPYELKGAIAIRYDRATARAWYKRSRELMDAAVDFYLKRLDGPLPEDQMIPARLDMPKAR